MADRMQRRCAVNNALRWLVVKAYNIEPTMQDFYKIPVQQLADFTTRTYLGMNSSLKFKIRWSNPNVKTMAGLRGIEELIPGYIRTHFQAIQDGHVGYFHMELHRDNVGGPRWAWQREVPIKRVSGVDRNQTPGAILHRGSYVAITAIVVDI
jgi:hypothetical protein